MKFAAIAVLCASVSALRLNRSDYHDGPPTDKDKVWGHLDDEVVFHDTGVHFDKVGFSQKNITVNATANITSNASKNASRNATGVSDESYETNVDNREASITTQHRTQEGQRNDAVNSQSNEDAWRGVKPKW